LVKEVIKGTVQNFSQEVQKSQNDMYCIMVITHQHAIAIYSAMVQFFSTAYYNSSNFSDFKKEVRSGSFLYAKKGRHILKE
jgi:hypothetical protein